MLSTQESHAQINRVVVNVSSASSNVIVAAQGAGKKIRVLYFFLVTAGATNVTWEDSDGTDLVGLLPLAANGGISGTYCPYGIFETSANKGLNLLLGSANQTGGIVHYQVIGGTSAT